MGDEMSYGVKTNIERETTEICLAMGFHRLDIARAFEAFIKRETMLSRSAMYQRSWIVGYLTGQRDLEVGK